jgi:hypothetical protein
VTGGTASPNYFGFILTSLNHGHRVAAKSISKSKSISRSNNLGLAGSWPGQNRATDDTRDIWAYGLSIGKDRQAISMNGDMIHPLDPSTGYLMSYSMFTLADDLPFCNECPNEYIIPLPNGLCMCDYMKNMNTHT